MRKSISETGCCFAALLLMAGGSCCSHQQATASLSYAQSCMEADYPALLLKAERREKPLRVNDEEGDLEPVFLVLCRVLAAVKLPVKAGEEVLLTVPSGRSGNETGPAERTQYWFLSGEDGGEWAPVLMPGKTSAYTANATDFYGFDAEQVLLPLRGELHGVWRQMADMVAEKK